MSSIRREILTLTPPQRCDAQLAIASIRAGALGILNVSPQIPVAARQSALRQLAAHARDSSSWGLRWEGDDLTWLETPVPVLVLASWGDVHPEKVLARGRGRATQLILEVHSLRAALAAQAAGADGVILKGHEAGGLTGADSAFLLLADALWQLTIPYWLQGGIGLHTGAAAILGGATGVVLCEQLWLADEAPFSSVERTAFEKLDGSETVFLGDDTAGYRCFNRVQRQLVQQLERDISGGSDWQALLRPLALADNETPLVPMGQEIAFAHGLAQKYGTAGGIIGAFRKTVAESAAQLRRQRALEAGSGLAQSHATTYPLVQGPMTRVSDRVAFCEEVARNGALPFLALALMPGSACRALLLEAKQRLGERSWGVGILGFVPPELRQEQLAAVREAAPPFALIAGGRPSQAVELERQGIVTYLHVPSPGLLKAFLQEGSRHFIFEGRECGGHVGPRSSFTLWQAAIDVLLEANLPDPERCHILFAGGIHERVSAALVDVVAAPLTRRGMKVGALMGTAYLFTTEAVESGAITANFQEQMLACQQTTLLESGVGHASRCMVTPFADEFRAKKRALVQAGKSAEQIQIELELLNLGRLRLAAKGLARARPAAPLDDKTPLLPVDAEGQFRDGMFMIGQLVTRRDQRLTMAKLHEEVCAGSGRLLATLLDNARPAQDEAVRTEPACDVAIIGIACRFPDAPDVRRFWQNVVSGHSPIREIPPERWDKDQFFNPDRLAADQVYSRWGAFLDECVFDPMKYRIPPASLPSIEPIQLLTLETAWQALQDAGYQRRALPRERTAVIFGVSGPHDLGMAYGFRTMLRQYLPQVRGLSQPDRERLRGELEALLPVWTEDSFPGFLNNMISGRISNALNLMGPNFVVDAACASAVAAVDVALDQLRSGRSDMVLVGAADATNNPCGFMSFAKTQALSPRGVCSPFDVKADGIVLGEGISVLVLKRLADAERDGDSIYAVIKGIGSASDGRNRSLTAPHAAGQLETLRRAYADARVDPGSVSLFEAHGTGTALGDRTELTALTELMRGQQAPPRSCGVGSIKSMIGHTKSVAGLASLTKIALALKHRLLPPTLNVETPSELLQAADCPLYPSTQTRPWCQAQPGPRRAGVSAFGFGGTNFHVVVEEYVREYRDGQHLNLLPRAAEIFAWSRATRAELLQALRALQQQAADEIAGDLPQLACSVWWEEQQRGPRPAGGQRLALVASSVADLRKKIDNAVERLAQADEIENPTGIYGRAGSPLTADQVCLLFPGQGTQAVNMLGGLLQAFPWGHALLEEADAVLADRLGRPLSSYLFPPPTFAAGGAQVHEEELNDTRIAQPALGVMSVFALEVLRRFGVQAACAAGHSYGELVALHAAGALGRRDLFDLSAARGQLMHGACQSLPGGMLAVPADAAAVQAALAEHGLPLTLANVNAPDQTVVSGPLAAIEAALALPAFAKARKLRVSAPFHSPVFAALAPAWRQHLDRAALTAPRLTVFSNTTALPFGQDPDEIRLLLTRQLAEPVLFDAQVRALHARGARLFLEVGPGSVLTGLVAKILSGNEHTAVSISAGGRDDLMQLAHVLARCVVAGLPVDLSAWFEGRRLENIAVDELLRTTQAARQRQPTDWLISGAHARPAGTQQRSISEKPATIEATPNAAPAPCLSANGSEKRMADVHPANAAVNGNDAKPKLIGHEPVTPLLPAVLPAARALPQPEAQGMVASFQETMKQWLALQEHYLRTQEQFLGLQERMLMQAFQQAPSFPPAPMSQQALGNGHAPVHVQPSSPSPPVSTHAAPPVPTPAARVPRAPVLPALRSTEATATPAPAAPAPASNGAALLDTEEFTKDLLAAVKDRTGYPLEVLDLDLPLEAGLGIDSIKRIEILNSLKKYNNVFLMVERSEEEALANFARLKTLRDIIQAYDQERQKCQSLGGKLPAANGTAIKKAVPAAPVMPRVAAATPANGPASHAAVDEPTILRRFVLKPVALPASAEPDLSKPQPAHRSMLILGKTLGPKQLVDGYEQVRQQPIFQILPGSAARQLSPNRFEVDFASLESLTALRQLLPLAANPLQAVMNLLPLDQRFEESAEFDAEAALCLSQWTFNFLKVFADDLNQPGAEQPCALFHFTSLGGQFGLNPDRPLPLCQAGTLGVMKTFALEFPGVRVKNIDLDLKCDPDYLFARVLHELVADDSLAEVGINQDGRWRIELSEEPASATNASPRSLGPESVILITGGGYGIMARLAQTLAQSWGVKLILVGRTPLQEQEEEESRAIADPDQLLSHYFEKARRAGACVLPREIEKSVQAILRNRQIRANLQELRRLCPVVEYHAVDVRDVKALTSLVESVYQRHGRIDGVIHGAGIIEDSSIASKEAESFARVFNTKVQGAINLARALRGDSLQFFVLTSSIAARFGNAGQVDYSAANEYLNKLADHLNRTWRGRVVAINWGPWNGGMVSPQLARLLKSHQVGLIPLDAGAQAFLDELRHGSKQHAEVVIRADHPQTLAVPWQGSLLQWDKNLLDVQRSRAGTV